MEAFISNFTMTIDDVVFVGDVLEAEEAVEAYNDAKYRDASAGMVGNS